MIDFEADISTLDDGRVCHFRLTRNQTTLSYSEVIDRWIEDAIFRCYFRSLLADSPFPACYWETPPVTLSTIDREFEFVLVNSPQLAGVRASQRAFASYFAPASKNSVVRFSNLGGDATLVVPRPGKSENAYAHLSEFTRNAPQEQQHELWSQVGTAMRHRLDERPVWLSTSGLGVYWLHIRLDNYPKYYTHAPYRSC